MGQLQHKMTIMNKSSVQLINKVAVIVFTLNTISITFSVVPKEGVITCIFLLLGAGIILALSNLYFLERLNTSADEFLRTMKPSEKVMREMFDKTPDEEASSGPAGAKRFGPIMLLVFNSEKHKCTAIKYVSSSDQFRETFMAFLAHHAEELLEYREHQKKEGKEEKEG